MPQYEVVKIDRLSGCECSIYSIVDGNNETKTLFDKFIDENIHSFKSEVIEIISRLKSIGNKTGARVQFFKENEGALGDGVCALYDEGSSLRLYCIRYGKQLVIVGGGGHKPKSIRALQNDKKLKKENYFLRKMSALITERISEQEIIYTNGGMDFKGNLVFSKEEFSNYEE